jgi:tetratricopeptide (TPR) repeat protein
LTPCEASARPLGAASCAPALFACLLLASTSAALRAEPAAPDDDIDRPAPQAEPQAPYPTYRNFGTIFGVPRDGAQMPSTVIGPGGVIQPMAPSARQTAPAPHPPTAEERAARIRKALAPKPPLAVVRRHTLDDLYTKLAAAKDPDEAKSLASLIGNIWLRSGSDTANLLMQRALDAIGRHDYKVASDMLDRIIALKPDWAEAWNKRAAVRFYQGDFDGAMADVEHVLKLEPKHFGALDGMGSILQRTGFDKRALEVFRRSLQIYPFQPDVQKIVDKLQLDVEGQGI